MEWILVTDPSLNYPMIDRSAQRGILFTRGGPYQKNDQATIESKNNHLVRRYEFYYRYHTPVELTVLKKV